MRSVPQSSRRLSWSRYNQLFTSAENEHFIYNSLTSTFAELDEDTHRAMLRIQEAPGAFDFQSDPGLYLQLRLAKVLVEDGEEAALLQRIQEKRVMVRQPAATLGLTILPTTACNFDCPYCYEHGRPKATMSDATAAKVVEFIRTFGRLRALSITWFGGEPLLQFDRICGLTRAIEATGIPLSSRTERAASAPSVRVSIVTNGYLLTEERIEKLDELGIRSVQITLDGTQPTHDRRRRRIGGAGSYAQLMENIDRLLTRWSGDVVIRTNLDHANADEYALLRADLAARFPGKRLRFRPGIVKDCPDAHGHSTCEFETRDRDAMALELYGRWGCKPRGFYPYAGQAGCAATYENSFVIGPDGSLYKCWHDAGNPARAVGSVHDDRVPHGRNPLAAEAGDVFDDAQCQQCFLLPVCDGGCLHYRARRVEGGETFDTCRYFKGRLPEFLEAYRLKKRAAANASP